MQNDSAAHFDVMIVGVGFGGTWRAHRYPAIRSDVALVYG
jgi:cation diffusion facilitator CzcD-associated flavoprotein CzcO